MPSMLSTSTSLAGSRDSAIHHRSTASRCAIHWRRHARAPSIFPPRHAST